MRQATDVYHSAYDAMMRHANGDFQFFSLFLFVRQ